MADPGLTRRGVIASSAILAAGLAVAGAAKGAHSIADQAATCRRATSALNRCPQGPEQLTLIQQERQAYDRLATMPARNVGEVRDKFRVLFGSDEQSQWAADCGWWRSLLADLERLA